MQFLVDRDEWLERLTTLRTIIETKTEVAILRNIKVEACTNAILLSATDNDMHLTMSCPAEVTEEGVITAEGPLICDIVKKCPKGGHISVTLGGKPKRRKAAAADDDKLRLVSGKAEFSLKTLPAGDWPLLQPSPGAAEFRLECRDLRSLIEKTRFAIATDETRYYLTGIYLHALGEQLAAVATDGHRLALKRLPLPAGADDMPAAPDEEADTKPRAKQDGRSSLRGIIIPRDAVSAALKILPDSEVECELACSDSLMRLRIGEIELISRLIDGTYPDYQRVIPQNSIHRVIAPREALATAVARVATVLTDKGQSIRLQLYADRIELSAYSTLSGHSARETVEDCVAELDVLTVGLNPRYLAEILETLDGGQLAIILDSPSSPLLFEEVDGDGSLRLLLMPMRLDGQVSEDVEETKKKAA